MHRSSIITRALSAPAQERLLNTAHGTRVVARDLFGAMPVRVKQRAASTYKHGGNSKDWEQLRQDVTALLLSWTAPITVILQNTETRQKFVVRSANIAQKPWSELDKRAVCNILSQAGWIPPIESSSYWIPLKAVADGISVEGVVSLKGSPTKSVQFISMGFRPLFTDHGRPSVLHEEINRLFFESSFGSCEKGDLPDLNHRTNLVTDKNDGYRDHYLKSGRKPVDRYPRFYFRISVRQVQSGERPEQLFTHNGTLLTKLMELLGTTVGAFLSKYHFQSKPPLSLSSRGLAIQTFDVHNSPNIVLSRDTRTRATTVSSGSCPQIVTKDLRKGFIQTGFELSHPNKLSKSASPLLQSWSHIGTGTSTSSPHCSLHRRIRTEKNFRDSAPPRTIVHTQPLALSGVFDSEMATTSPGQLLSRDGKLVCRPFKDVTFASVPTQSAGLTSSYAGRVAGNLNLWVNPVTKKRSFVDRNTGHSLPELQSTEPANSPAGTILQHTPTGSLKSVASQASWLSSVLQRWDNPVYQPTELPVHEVCFDGAGESTKELMYGRHTVCSQAGINRVFPESCARLTGQLTKDSLNRAKIISQLDSKFILINVTCKNSNQILIVIDQHAGDERVRVESLLKSLFTASPRGDGRIVTSTLNKPLNFEVNAEEITMLQRHADHFLRWGIVYSIPTTVISASRVAKSGLDVEESHRLTVTSLPLGIHQRCKQEPRLLIDILRTEIWKVQNQERKGRLDSMHEFPTDEHDWLYHLDECPQGIIDLLNSRACRSAIMFNDVLSISQCAMLVKGLAVCKFPFQCAHGRPTMVPLVDLTQMQGSERNEEKYEDEKHFASRFVSWKRGQSFRT